MDLFPRSQGELATELALEHRGALLKVITPNDAGVTGAHQAGFHLPKRAWKYFSPHAPTPGQNNDHPVAIIWPDGSVSSSGVKWYGQLTRREYRLTRFGRGFQFRSQDDVGGLLVLVKTTPASFSAFILKTEEEIEEIQAALGVDVSRGWALYTPELLPEEPLAEGAAECIERQFKAFSEPLSSFPTGEEFTEATWQALEHCRDDFQQLDCDEKLLLCMHSEYDLFRKVEGKLCAADVHGPFDAIDDFLKLANTILQRRKSRAGRSLENHVGRLLEAEAVPYDTRASIEGRPDVVIPSAKAYDDASYPDDKLFVVAVKTTCRDRWRQVVKEGPRARRRYLITTQRGISQPQMQLMHEAGITLVVPKAIQKDYPAQRKLVILSLEEFVAVVRRSHPAA